MKTCWANQVCKSWAGKPGNAKPSAAIKQLKQAFIADYVMLGGGNAKVIENLPDGVELGHNRNAYLGGCRMWETNPESKRPRWRIV